MLASLLGRGLKPLPGRGNGMLPGEPGRARQHIGRAWFQSDLGYLARVPLAALEAHAAG
jgi:hypothetical protein